MSSLFLCFNECRINPLPFSGFPCLYLWLSLSIFISMSFTSFCFTCPSLSSHVSECLCISPSQSLSACLSPLSLFLPSGFISMSVLLVPHAWPYPTAHSPGEEPANLLLPLTCPVNPEASVFLSLGWSNRDRGEGHLHSPSLREPLCEHAEGWAQGWGLYG